MQEQNSSEEEVLSLGDLAARIGITDLNTPDVYDIEHEGYEIESLDQETGKTVWKPMTHFVVKENAESHYQLNTLHGTEMHRVLHQGEWKSLKDVPGAELVKAPIQVVDITVADTHNYLAEGQVNHNTTTPGGMAIPFASSVRIRLQGGTPIKKGDAVIGSIVTAKTIKNKTEMPFRECQFSIIFGKGVEEHEQIFDAMRLRCDAEKDKMVHTDKWLLQVEGTGAWKYFRVLDAKTGENLHEVKFYKGDFGEKVLRVPAFKDHVRALMDATYVMRMGESSHQTLAGLTAEDDVIGQG